MITWKSFLLTFLLASIITIFLLIRNQTPNPIIKTSIPQINETALQEAVNSYRVKQGLSKLPTDSKLCIYATERAEQIKTDWSHDPFQANNCSGTGYGYCGENLSENFYTERATLDAWLASQSHADNIKSNWSATCVKCSENYCAQEFGK